MSVHLMMRDITPIDVFYHNKNEVLTLLTKWFGRAAWSYWPEHDIVATKQLQEDCCTMPYNSESQRVRNHSLTSVRCMKHVLVANWSCLMIKIIHIKTQLKKDVDHKNTA